MSIKVFIQGSCVTRDSFEYNLDKKFEIIHYGARSSIASLCFSSIKKPFDLSKLQSNFQKKMLEDDHNRNLFQYILEKNFDLFIMDFIDERGGLININNLGYVTNLAELKSSGVTDTADSIEIIEPYSNYHKRLFFAGFNRIYNELKKINKENSCIINKVFWATRNEKDEYVTPTIDHIIKANDFLEDIYSHISKHYPKIQFIEYSNKNIIANSNHKWGMSPFHYVDGFYLETLERIDNIYALKDLHFNNSTIEYKENKILFNAEIDAPYEVEFAAYLFNGFRRVNEIWYQDCPSFEFNVLDKGTYKVRLFCRRKGDKFIKTKFSEALSVD